MKSHFRTLVVILLLVSLFPRSAFASESAKDQLFPQDLEEKALEAIEGQSLSLNQDLQEIQGYIAHFIENTKNYRKVYNNWGYNASSTGSDGTYTSSGFGASEGCYHYANFLATTIYGELGPVIEHDEYPGSISPQGLKDFLEKYAQAGEHIRIDGYHSLIFISSDGQGFYSLEYNGDYRDPYAAYNSYEYFSSLLNQMGRDFYLYDSNRPTKKPGNLENINYYDSYGSTPQWNLANRSTYLEHAPQEKDNQKDTEAPALLVASHYKK